MERQQPLFFSFACYFYCFLALVLALLPLSNAIESPQYTVIRSEPGVEIRLYEESSWMSALVPGGTSFEKSTKDGFHRLYQYIHGANLNSSNLMKTAPVLTSITTQSSHESNYTVRLYVSAKYGGAPPQPNPELNLVLDKWRSHCIAVRTFSGFAKDDNINKEMEALVTVLGKISGGKPDSIEGKGSYSIAQYNASFHQSGRLNEVWMNVSGFAAEGCPS
ncbi:uncharacterized protein LOC131310212 [Rhododendron vialii]|uniref:uncharacterized protein LOC131310212 n=1 Tax=Rhododendron vialii TaxID=182163 RepID=UPI00265F0EA4|nr:uncharacterized protein LOC131310212 [Rhododendron vialii]